MRKKFLALALAVVCLFTNTVSTLAQNSIDAVGSEYKVSMDGLYLYEIKTVNGEACAYLERYQGREVNVVIPESIDGYTVRGILMTTLFPNDYPVETVKLPNTITSIAAGAFATTYSLKSITIDKYSKDGFYSEEGILYCGDTIVAYPAAKEDEIFIIPQHVSSIMREAFYGCSNLKKVIIPNSVTDISRGAFTRCKTDMSIVMKKNGFSNSDINDMNTMCCEVASGTKILVKTKELKEKVLSGMTATNVYNDNERTMAVEVAEAIPATSLTFTDGNKQNHVTVSYTDTGYSADRQNTFYLHSLYRQAPADTTENVTWTVKNGEEFCGVTSEGTMYTYSGGEAVVIGKDESGHEIILNVTIYSPMDSYKLYFESARTPVGESDYNYVKIEPYSSYANNAGITWQIADTSIATVEKDGRNGCNINGIDVGTTTLTATIDDNGNLIQKTIPVSVYDYITNCTVDSIATQTYVGKPLEPKPVVRYKGRVLTEGVDYIIEYYDENDFMPPDGTGEIFINGLNTTFFKGTDLLEAKFNIVDGRENASPTNSNGQIIPPTSESDTEGSFIGNGNVDKDTDQEKQTQITGVESSYTKTYGGTPFSLKATGPGDVTYSSSNKKVIVVGKTSGKVTIKGIGKGTITIKSGNLIKKVTIKVIPKNVSSVKIRAEKESIKVFWKKDKSVTGYQIQYATNNKFTKGKNAAIIKKNKTSSYKISNRKNKKKYYVRVRSYKAVEGKKYYSKWSKVISTK